ncbi:MAG: FtsQ-type POTRA domain-containing protein [Cyanobacteria bacterium REEB459]|nr:FtsQ-type POTRA domain-containing protein [Cyanobacteria bacterium REEB459]
MTPLAPLSRQQLQTRRQALRRQRQISLGQSCWRWLALLGLTAASFWVATRPNWVIQSPRQIQVTGTRLLSAEMIQDLVPLSYPQSLMEIDPQAIAQQLRQRAPVVRVKVNRQLLPPGLLVTVQERLPVAVVLPTEQAQGQFLQAGLIDDQGAWMPMSSLGQLRTASPPLPALKLQGMKPEYQRYWPQLYATIHRSPVAIHTIDWRDPANLVLETDLGKVYLGPYTAELGEQLATLDKMRNLPQRVKKSLVAHIDLTKPEQPAITLTPDGMAKLPAKE